MKVFPIYIVFEASILYREAEQAIELIKRTIVRFRTNPYDLEIVSLGIMAYQADVHIIRKLTPIIDIDYKIDKKLYDLKAPIKKNTKVGVLKISYDNKEYSYDLIVKEDIKKASFLKTYFNLFKDIISGTKS